MFCISACSGKLTNKSYLYSNTNISKCSPIRFSASPERFCTPHWIWHWVYSMSFSHSRQTHLNPLPSFIISLLRSHLMEDTLEPNEKSGDICPMVRRCLVKWGSGIVRRLNILMEPQDFGFSPSLLPWLFISSDLDRSSRPISSCKTSSTSVRMNSLRHLSKSIDLPSFLFCSQFFMYLCLLTVSFFFCISFLPFWIVFIWKFVLGTKIHLNCSYLSGKSPSGTWCSGDTGEWRLLKENECKHGTPKKKKWTTSGLKFRDAGYSPWRWEERTSPTKFEAPKTTAIIKSLDQLENRDDESAGRKSGG